MHKDSKRYSFGAVLTDDKAAYAVRDTWDDGRIVALYINSNFYPYIDWASMRAKFKAWRLNRGIYV